MKGNYIFVERGRKCFEVSSNFTNYLELGIEGITKYYLEAKIQDGEFKISGTLLDESGEVLCRLNNNFIEASRDYTKEMTPNGYRIKDKDGNPIFEIRVENDLICHLKGTIHGGLGEIVAQDREDGFTILKGPAIIGKSDGAIGIKLG